MLRNYINSFESMNESIDILNEGLPKMSKQKAAWRRSGKEDIEYNPSNFTKARSGYYNTKENEKVVPTFGFTNFAIKKMNFEESLVPFKPDDQFVKALVGCDILKGTNPEVLTDLRNQIIQYLDIYIRTYYTNPNKGKLIPIIQEKFASLKTDNIIIASGPLYYKINNGKCKGDNIPITLKFYGKNDYYGDRVCFVLSRKANEDININYLGKCLSIKLSNLHLDIKMSNDSYIFNFTHSNHNNMIGKTIILSIAYLPNDIKNPIMIVKNELADDKSVYKIADYLSNFTSRILKNNKTYQKGNGALIRNILQKIFLTDTVIERLKKNTNNNNNCPKVNTDMDNNYSLVTLKFVNSQWDVRNIVGYFNANATGLTKYDQKSIYIDNDVSLKFD